MSELLDALRARYATPEAVVRALGLDEALLSENEGDTMPAKQDTALGFIERLKPMLAQDANIQDLLELLDALKGAGGGEAPPMAEEPDEYEDQDEDTVEEPTEDEIMQPNSALPLGGEEKKPTELPPALGAEKVGTDNEDGGKSAQIRALLAQLMELIGGDVPATDEEPKGGDAGGLASSEPPVVSEDKKPHAMDAAITAAVKRERQNAREIREAERAVRPYVGELAIACDSADEVYRHALIALGVDDAKTIHASALPTLIRMQQKPNAGGEARRIAMDAAGLKNFAEIYPNAARIRAA